MTSADDRHALSAHFAEAGFTHFEFQNERPVSKSSLNAYISPLADKSVIGTLEAMVTDGRPVGPHHDDSDSSLLAAHEFLKLEETEIQPSYGFLEFLGYQRDWRAPGS